MSTTITYEAAVRHIALQVAKMIKEQRTESSQTTIDESPTEAKDDIEFFVNEQLPEDVFQKTIDIYKTL